MILTRWMGLFLVVSAISGCSIQRAVVARGAQEKMVGLSKEQVLSCMGVIVGNSIRLASGVELGDALG